VTTRAGGDDDLEDGNGQETRPAGIIAAARRRTQLKSAKAGPVTAAPASGNGSDGTARGAAATGDAPTDEATVNGISDTSFSAGSTDTVAPGSADDASSDATIADGVPALPADNLGSPRGIRPKGKDATRAGISSSEGTEPSPAADPPPTPTSSTSPPPSSAPPSSAAPSSPDAPAVSPAAFAWDMPDPPPSSPSSPARSFLRTGTRNQPASKTPAATVGLGKTTPDEAPAASLSAQKKASKRSARQAHLTVARVEPWSVMKFSFVVSLVAFVILFVAVSVLYGALAGLGVFDSLQRVVSSVTSSQSSAGVNAAKWWSASRILGYTALLGSLNIVLITAMSTIGAVVYNLTSRLVGGVEVTLRETE
jgi:Transmembrane domain of unknown function (DUF3566)